MSNKRAWNQKDYESHGKDKSVRLAIPLWYLQEKLADILALFVTKVLEVTQQLKVEVQ